MPTQVRVKIGSVDLSFPTEVVPVKWDTVLAWRRDGDTVNFEFNPKSDMLLYCAILPDTWDGDATAWENMVDAGAGCSNFEVSVEAFCSGSWSEIWGGKFSSKDWKINYDKKTIIVRPKQYTGLNCLKDGWGATDNPYSVSPFVTVKPYLLTYITQAYQLPQSSGTCPAAPTPAGLCYDEFGGTVNTGGGGIICIYHFHRFQKNGTCDGATPVPPDDYNTWTLLSGGCPGTPVYWTCPDGARQPYEYRGGRMLSGVLEHLLENIDCGLTIKSDFFGINDDATHPDNSAYDAALLHLQSLVVFQKSDIKRHDASNPSNILAWDMKLQDLLSDLKTMFKVDWRVLPGDILRLEHISYFEATAGNDYTNEKYVRELEYDKEQIPRITRFEYRDKHCSDYFKGLPIEIYCGEGDSDVKLRLFSCDLSFISDADNAESIGDDGWVLMATVDNAGTLYNATDNRQLSWTKLHDNYHTYGMPGAGKINGVDITPSSFKKIRKQPAFSVRHCCGDDFDPQDYITTSLGNAEVDAAEWTVAKDLLTLEPKY